MRWWFLAAGAAVLAATAAGVLLASKHGPAPKRVSTPAAPDASACPNHSFTMTRPPASAALVVIGASGLTVSVDGFAFTPGARLTSAPHRFEVKTEGLAPVRLTLDVKPFTPVVLDVQRDGPALVAVVAGAVSPQCQGFSMGPRGVATATSTADDVALSLAAGDCRRAFELLAHLPAGPRQSRQLQAALSLAGAAPSSAAQLTAQQHRASEAAIERAWLTAQWDALTERLSRATQRLAPAASGVVTASHERMETLSDAFSEAAARRDSEAQRAVVDSAEQVVRDLAEQLVALRPADCAWRLAVQQALEP